MRKGIASVRCPICNGKINNMWLASIQRRKGKEYAVFICECWSGDLNKKGNYHIFKIRVKLPEVLEIDQLKLAQETINQLEAQLQETEPCT
jgi:hypothetical protein